jgi:hypothetical protein
MEIVIEIDENLYTRLFDNGVDNYDDAVDMAKAIRKGTPLPKGHGRLKDVDRFESHDEYIGQGFTKSVYKDDIDNAPTIIEADKECERE